MANITKVIKEISDVFGFKYDSKRNIAYGEKQGYKMLVDIRMNGSQFVHIGVCVDINGSVADKALLESVTLPKSVKISTNNNAIDIIFPPAMKLQTNTDTAVSAAQALLRMLAENNAVNCDITGKKGEIDIYSVKGEYVFLTAESADELRARLSIDKGVEAEKTENYILGTIGALVGSLAGVLLILLIARLGRISAISGIVMGIAVSFMYLKFAKKFSRISVIICCFISIVMTYIAFRLDIAIDLYSALKDSIYHGVSFMTCFVESKSFFVSIGETGTYYHNLFLMMLMGCVGGIGAPIAAYSAEKNKFSFEKVS